MYQAEDFSIVKGINSLSDKLLENHFLLYEAYVKNTNLIDEKLAELSKQKEGLNSPEYNELKRRFGWEFNGMRLHEYFFENLTKEQTMLKEDSALYQKIVDDFGSFDAWKNDFLSTAKIRGNGWAILYYDFLGDRLFNVWINEHDKGHLAGEAPILVIDAFEHAYMIDYGLKRPEYIAKIWENIDWEIASDRFEG